MGDRHLRLGASSRPSVAVASLRCEGVLIDVLVHVPIVFQVKETGQTNSIMTFYELTEGGDLVHTTGSFASRSYLHV